MTTKKDLLLKNVDHILLVNKDYEIVYNSRFDPAIGNKPDAKEYKNFFEMYPSLGRNNSSIVKTMSTGTSIFRDAQEFIDTILESYTHPNVQLDLRIPKAGSYLDALDLGVSQALSGDLDVPSALQYVYDAWEEITDEQGRDTQLQFYHNTYASVTTGTGVS